MENIFARKRIHFLIFGLLFMFCMYGCDNSSNAPDTTPPAKIMITGITAADIQISLTWEDPAETDLDHVEITWTDGTTPGGKNVSAGEEACTIGSLSAETKYTITVRAADKSGNLSEADSFSVTTAATGQTIEFIKISTAEELNNVRNGLFGHYLLIADIDLEDYDPIGDGTGWIPIGDDAAQFIGTFNGNSKVIRNLTINRPSDYQGLFGFVGTGGRIENLGLDKIDVSGDCGTGALVGNNNGSVSGCYVKGEVNGSKSVGGLLGDNDGKVSDSYASVDVNGSGYAGGLVGYNANGGTVSGCYATGIVNGEYKTGGLLGANSEGTVTNSYSTGAVTGTAECTGGLVGGNDGGTVSNCYTVSIITETTGATYVGGFTGWDDKGVYTACLWDSDLYTTAPADIGYDGTSENIDSINISAETTASMKLQATFQPGTDDWDFDTVWAIDSSINSGYPYLQDNPPVE